MPRGMVIGAAVEKLMKRLGFVKLGRYGLALTFDDRVTTLRPVVLDDGMGGRVVGWKDNDLAQADLAAWPAGQSLVMDHALPSQPQPIAPPVMRRQTIPPPTPMIPPRAALTISPIAAPPPPPPPLPEPEPDAEPDEDWEWTLAVARARAAEEDVIVRPVIAPLPVVAAAPPPRPVLVSVPIEVPAAKTAPLRVARIPELVSPARATVIPVPTLPRYANTSHPSVYRPQPVVRTPSSFPETRRFARGTLPADRDLVPANDDGLETSTQVQALPDGERTATQLQRAPTAVSAGGIPSIKHRMVGR